MLLLDRRGTDALVVLGAFVVMLLGSANASAGALAAAAESLEPGQWMTFNTHNDGSGFSGDLLAVEPPANILQYADKGMWDPNARRLLFMGEGHYASFKYISYDDASDQWRLEPSPPWNCAPSCASGSVGHAYHHSTINPTNGDVYARMYNSGRIHKYTQSTKSWSSLPNVPETLPCCAAIEFFPELNALVAVGDGTLLLFEEGSKQWRVLDRGLAMGPYHNVAYYDAVGGRVLFGGGNGSRDVYKLDASRKVAKLANAPVNFGINATINVVDPVTGRLLIFRNGSSAYELDVDRNEWTAFDPGNAPFSGSNPAADKMATAISTYGVILLAHYNGSGSRTYLYKHAPGHVAPPDKIRPNPPTELTAR